MTTDAEGNTRLSYIRQKTGGKFSPKLLSTAQAIIEQYRAETYTEPDAYVFPILHIDQHETEEQINNWLNKILGQVNRDLKLIGKQTGIETPLSTYVTRQWRWL